MTAAFKGGLSVKHGDGAGTEVFTAIEELISLSGLGKSNPLIDATSHDSSAREYIAGLPDGSELTIECNRVHTASNIQDAVIADIDAGNTTNYQITLTDGSNIKTYDFAAVNMSWDLGTSYEDKNTITFTLKISGAITVS